MWQQHDDSNPQAKQTDRNKLYNFDEEQIKSSACEGDYEYTYTVTTNIVICVYDLLFFHFIDFSHQCWLLDAAE